MTTALTPNATSADADLFTVLGEVPVDSARLLLVDPCHIPADLLATLIRPNAHGIACALMVATPCGDGLYGVLADATDGTLTVLNAYEEAGA